MHTGAQRTGSASGTQHPVKHWLLWSQVQPTSGGNAYACVLQAMSRAGCAARNLAARQQGNPARCHDRLHGISTTTRTRKGPSTHPLRQQILHQSNVHTAQLRAVQGPRHCRLQLQEVQAGRPTLGPKAGQKLGHCKGIHQAMHLPRTLQQRQNNTATAPRTTRRHRTIAASAWCRRCVCWRCDLQPAGQKSP